MGLEVIFEKHMNFEQRRFLVLISAIVLKLTAGQIYCTVIYAEYVKSVFHLNQRELDTSLSMVSLGSTLMIISGLFYDRFGPRLSVLLSGAFSVLMQSVVVSILLYPAAIGSRVWVLCLLLFVYGHSFCYSYIAAIGTCMSSFPVQKRAITMAIIDSAFVITLPLLAFLYYLLMGYKDVKPAEQYPLGIFLFLIIVTLMSHIFAFLFLSPVENEYYAIPDTILEEQPEHVNSAFPMSESTPILSSNESRVQTDDTDSQQSEECDRLPPKHDDNVSVKDFMKRFLDTFISMQYLPFFVAFVCIVSVQTSIALNVTTVSRSLGQQSHNLQFLLVPTLFGIAFRFLMASISDRFFSLAYQRLLLLFAVSATFGCVGILFLSVPVHSGISSFGLIISGLIFCSFEVAAIFTLTPVFLSQIFGHKMFGQLYSACCVMGVLAGLWLSISFGAIYDNEARSSHLPTDASTCVGHRCYMYGMLIGLFVHFVGIGFLLGYSLFIRKKSQRH